MQMRIVESTQAYEAWLGSETSLLAPDLRAKHKAMAAGAFPFCALRFTVGHSSGRYWKRARR